MPKSERPNTKLQSTELKQTSLDHFRYVKIIYKMVKTMQYCFCLTQKVSEFGHLLRSDFGVIQYVFGRLDYGHLLYLTLSLYALRVEIISKTTRILVIFYIPGCLGWYIKFLLKIELKFLLGEATARLYFKIYLGTLHAYPGINPLELI